MATITTKIEAARGCGYRKGGGIYLVSDGIGAPCCKLPYELTVCPCCHAGIKPSRGFQWVSSSLFSGSPCFNPDDMATCPMNLGPDIKVGLMWVGEKFYPTALDFTREANSMGTSKRLAAIPKDIEVGKTWVYLAHRKAVSKIDGTVVTYFPGIFRAFRPDRIEYVVKGTETEEELEKLEKRGLTLVKVIRDIDAQLEIEVNVDDTDFYKVDEMEWNKKREEGL